MCRLGLCTAIALCVCSLSATAGERFGEWSLEQTGDFVFALSFKQSVSFDDRIATSELAFVCNEKEKYVAVLLIPFDGTLPNRQNSTPVLIQKTEEYSDRTDLMQRWESGPDYVYLESPDDREQPASYVKDREGEGVKSVHFYFPNDLDTGKATNHMIIDLSGFSIGLEVFKKKCE